MTSTPVHFHETYKNCLNCGAQVSNSFCSVCGQETRVHVPSAGEFIHEFVGHYVAVEGRLWKTLAYLLRKPGFLTAEYIAGRRKRYVEPLRVYLTFSIIFFALLKFGGPALVVMDPDPTASRNGVASATGKAAPPVAVPAEPTPEQDLAASAEEAATSPAAKPAVARKPRSDGDAMLEGLIQQFPSLEGRARAFASKPKAERVRLMTVGFFSYVPYAMFILMPLFALYLKLLYLGTGRRYGEHFLFALHTNAFAFAAMSLALVTIRLEWGFLTFLTILWVLAYLPLAMRRVYQGSRLLTGVRWLALMVLHTVSILVAIAVAFTAAILM